MPSPAPSSAPTGWRAGLLASELSWPFRSLIEAFPAGVGLPEVDQIDRALSPLAGVRFREATPRPRRRPGRPAGKEQLYDHVICERSEVPTRAENLHDLMNALVWACFPRSKRAVHALQLELIRARQGPDLGRQPQHRSREQDALAMLDEGGIVVVVSETSHAPIRSALARRDASALALEVAAERALGVVFGHALLEHLARQDSREVWGRAAVLVAERPRQLTLDELDGRLVNYIEDRGWLSSGAEGGSAPLCSSVLGRR